ncbi:hypothetical protein AMAG_03290 [Allomyces macrogynus ATCC 38327]|uniref:ubiquitinyl hydrolase 1 n=1 Tax=Allomyces macrogynus (strain ATCC 38327) TaxID=578462 RepID=A0A0L0S568_ALLM3|nr:hypothetical protein AMAG_03290 [Allomyces macrogynus ATCC 38327]|eukprot:KNE57600.1 hypothetical protein AMAG_03290 [Allomyces macrogynus ATCC 38327]
MYPARAQAAPPLPPPPATHHTRRPSLKQLFPSWPGHSRAPVTNAEDHERAVSALLDLIPENCPVATRAHAEWALAATGGMSVRAAAQYLEDWSEALAGAIHPPDLATAPATLRGIENSGNTCYVDSLVFALFACSDALDAVLTQDLSIRPVEVPVAAGASSDADDDDFPLAKTVEGPDAPSPPETGPALEPASLAPPPPTPEELHRAALLQNVQTLLVLVVNRLRKGHLVTKYDVRHLEAAIKALWRDVGTNAGLIGHQEDVSELFLLLVQCFKAPSLPLWQTIYHGGRADANDDMRIVTERCLALAIPDPKCKDPVHLEQLLASYFFDNRVSQIWRKVPKRHARGPVDQVPRVRRFDSSVSVESFMTTKVDGWSMMKLLPFLAGEDEAGERSTLLLPSSHTADQRMLVPMVLKRYYLKDQGPGKPPLPKRCARQVLVPMDIRFDAFTTDSSSSDNLAAPQHAGSTLVLRAVICHLGESPTAGHFVTYVNATPPTCTDEASTAAAAGPTWLRFDGVKDEGKIQCFTTTAAITRQFMDEVAKNAYMLFYEWVPASQSTVVADESETDVLVAASSTQDTEDGHLALEMQLKEYRKRRGLGRRDECLIM